MKLPFSIIPIGVSLVLCSCASTSVPKLPEPERTMMYMNMIVTSNLPVTVIQCLEEKVDFTVPVNSQRQIDAMVAAVESCINDFKESDSGKRYMKNLETKKKQLKQAPQQHIERL